MSADLFPNFDRAAVLADVSRWLDQAATTPLRLGEHHYLTLRVVHESGGQSWVTERGFAQPDAGGILEDAEQHADWLRSLDASEYLRSLDRDKSVGKLLIAAIDEVRRLRARSHENPVV